MATPHRAETLSQYSAQPGAVQQVPVQQETPSTLPQTAASEVPAAAAPAHVEPTHVPAQQAPAAAGTEAHPVSLIFPSLVLIDFDLKWLTSIDSFNRLLPLLQLSTSSTRRK